jgi:serine/threonine protein kinase/tetratricopeptide (TPR) repeat protein
MTDLLERLKASLSDRYEIDSEIGRGGMAVVFLALDRKLDRKVALKVLRPELASSLGPERFLREIEIAAGLTHPNILTLYDCGDAEGLLYYVMPYVDGESLRDRLSREKQLPIDEALAITREVADAIGYAHAQDIVHRDIKPANIMFSAGHAIVADFGIARAVTEAGGETLTQTGLAVGTPAYMSPEQATGESDIDSRSDLYSLGCVLFEMLTGEIPYAAATPQSLIAKKLHEPTPRVSVLRASVPASVEDSLQRLLANAPADRFRSAAELAEALGVRNGASERAFPERASTPLWRSPLTLVAALAVITVGFWAMLRSSAASGPSVESITVLPVQAAAGDSSSEAYATALTLSINSALGRIEGIVVKGHHSHSYLDPDLTDAEITRELGVDALLRTELLMQGGRVTVHSSLYDGDASMLWSGEYDHDLADLQNLAREVARDIASGIEIDLTTRDEALLAARDSVSPEALEEYLWGQLFWTQRGADGLRRGKEHFERAIALDSTYADAWAGLADAHNLLGFYQFLPPSLAYPRGRKAAQRALILDPQNARAHTALAAFYGWYDLDPVAAVQEFEAAMESDPEWWIAYAWICPILDTLGRSDEAIALCQQAIRGDPFYPIGHVAYGWRDWATGDSEMAVERFRTVLDLTPGSALARRMSGQALTELGRFEEAESQLRLALADTSHSSRVEAQLAYLLARTGRRDSAQAILDQLRIRVEAQAGDTIFQPYVSAFDLSVAFAGLGEQDSALAWLSEAYDERASELFLIPLDPRFEELRSDSRFQTLLERHWRSGEFE